MTSGMQPSRNQKQYRRGTTLVEVMLAAAMIAILALAAVTALMYPTLLIISDARRQVALHESGRSMELISAMPYDNITATNYNITALNETLNVSRSVVSTTIEKQISVTVRDKNGDLLVELITKRTPGKSL